LITFSWHKQKCTLFSCHVIHSCFFLLGVVPQFCSKFFIFILFLSRSISIISVGQSHLKWPKSQEFISFYLLFLLLLPYLLHLLFFYLVLFSISLFIPLNIISIIIIITIITLITIIIIFTTINYHYHLYLLLLLLYYRYIIV
jgi:hypothetical protein